MRQWLAWAWDWAGMVAWLVGYWGMAVWMLVDIFQSAESWDALRVVLFCVILIVLSAPGVKLAQCFWAKLRGLPMPSAD